MTPRRINTVAQLMDTLAAAIADGTISPSDHIYYESWDSDLYKVWVVFSETIADEPGFVTLCDGRANYSYGIDLTERKTL